MILYLWNNSCFPYL